MEETMKKTLELREELTRLEKEFRGFGDVRLLTKMSKSRLESHIERYEVAIGGMGHINSKAVEIYDAIQKEADTLRKKQKKLREEKKTILGKMKIKGKQKELKKDLNRIEKKLHDNKIILEARDTYLRELSADRKQAEMFHGACINLNRAKATLLSIKIKSCRSDIRKRQSKLEGTRRSVRDGGNSMEYNYIKRVEIKNFFLSFRKKTTVKFSNGLNVILGPNGGGKSNLLRAIFYGYKNIFSLTYTDSDGDEPRVKCTPDTEVLRQGIELSDRIHMYDGLFMSPEDRAALGLAMLASSTATWSDLQKEFQRQANLLVPELERVELSVAPGAPRICFTHSRGAEASFAAGERELLTLAFILALASHHNGPLILDDVGARIDKERGERVGALLRDIAKKRQVIIVSRNDYILAEGDLLLGVSWDKKEQCSKVTDLKV